MIDEDFFEEVTVKRRAKEVSSGNIWGKSIPRSGNCKRKFLFLMKEQAQGTEKDRDDHHGGIQTYSLCDPGKLNGLSLSISIKRV